MPIILLHGLYASSDSWMELVEDFHQSYQLILVDLRNHGRSPHTPSYSYDEMSTDLLCLLNELNIDQAVLIGHSMGGKVAMRFSLQHPERVKGLVVEDISPLSYSQTHDNALFHQKIVATLKTLKLDKYNTRVEVENNLNRTLHDSILSRFLLKNIERNRNGKLQWRFNLNAIASNLPQVMESITDNMVAPLNIPSLFIKSPSSIYISPEDEKAILLFFPQATIETIMDTGHWIHNDQKIKFMDSVKRYLSLLNSTD